MPGPGGGLLYVKWDDGSHMGVSPIDLYLIPTRVRETVRVRGRKKNPHEDDESISKIAMMLRPHFKDRRTLYIMSRSWHDYGFTPSQVRQYIDAGVTQPSKAAEMRLKQDIAKQRPRANPERSATSAAACATGMRAHTKSRRRIEKVCGKQAPKTHTASTRFSQMGVDARTRKLKR